MGVAEAWTNERKKKEVSERGNDYIIVSKQAKFMLNRDKMALLALYKPKLFLSIHL